VALIVCNFNELERFTKISHFGHFFSLYLHIAQLRGRDNVWAAFEIIAIDTIGCHRKA